MPGVRNPPHQRNRASKHIVWKRYRGEYGRVETPGGTQHALLLFSASADAEPLLSVSRSRKEGAQNHANAPLPQPPQYDEAAARTNRTTASSMIQTLCGTSASSLTSYRSAARNHCTWVRAILPLKDSVISASASFWLFQENIARSFGPTVSRCGWEYSSCSSLNFGAPAA